MDMLLLPLPDGPTQEEREGLKYTYPSLKWLYSGSEVEDNRYNYSNFHRPPTWLPEHIYAFDLLVDVEQIKKAYWTVIQDWRTRFPRATDNRVNEGEAEEDDFDPFIMLSGSENEIVSSGDDTYVFPSVDNDNDSGNVS